MIVKAISHLRTADPILKNIIDRIGECTLAPMNNYFVALLEAIISQQLSVKAAATIFSRFLGLYTDGKNPKPADILATPNDQLRQAGLSRQKLSYVKDLAEKLENGAIDTRKFSLMSDKEIIDELVQVKGIGRWTAEMFLIFALNRPDVLPVDDLGFRKAIKLEYNLSELPDAKQIEKIAVPWHPYSTIATWYLWESLDNAPLQTPE